MSKMTPPIFEPPADPEKVARRNAARRRQHKVDELDDGFTFRPSGRDGYVYYKEGDKLIELYWEMSGSDEQDILLSLSGLTDWASPVEPVPTSKQEEVLTALKTWLAANKIRALIGERRS